MWNLIRKDLTLQKNTLLIMLPLLIVVLAINSFMVWVGIIFCISIVMQSFYADEKTSIHQLLNSLPYTRKEIVSSKYIGACIFTSIVLMTMFIGNLIIYQEVLQWEQIAMIIGTVFLFISFAFPFSYQFHSQYLLIALGVLIVIYLIVISIFIPNLNDLIREKTHLLVVLGNNEWYLLAILAVLIVYTASWMLSIRIYSRKVF